MWLTGSGEHALRFVAGHVPVFWLWLRWPLDIWRSVYKPSARGPLQNSPQMPQLSMDRSIADAIGAPCCRMSSTILFRDCLWRAVAKPLLQSLPRVLHGLDNGKPAFVCGVGVPDAANGLFAASRYLSIDCRRNEVSLARVVGSEL